MRTRTLRFAFIFGLILTFSVIATSPPVLAQGETVLYSEDFEEGPAGWEPVNLQKVNGIMWHQTFYEGSGVAWCGTDDPSFVNAPGYGNFWTQLLTKSFTLPAGSPNLDFSIQFDVEVDYDYWYVEVSTDNGVTFIPLHQEDGQSSGGGLGFDTYSFDLTSYGGQYVVVRFRFSSDGGWSDEDGIIDTNGACRLDWVDVAGLRDEFDTDLDGWTPASIDPIGGPYRLETDPGGSSSQVWAAYDLEGPHAGQFPWTPVECMAQNRGVSIGIESPPIMIPPGQDSYILQFDFMGNTLCCEGVWADLEVGTGTSEENLVWRHDIWVYLTPNEFPNWHTLRVDLMQAGVGWDPVLNIPILGSIVTPGSTMMKIRVMGSEHHLCPFCDNHPAGPFFDNINLIIPDGPGVLAGSVSADCPAADTPLHGVKVVAYNGMGAEAGTAATDANGAFEMNLISGAYTLSLVTPLGYGSMPAEYPVVVGEGITTTQDFSLSCLEIGYNPRSIGYWKHQVSEALGNQGRGNNKRGRPAKKGEEVEEVTDVESPICDYLDLVSGHFNSNEINQVIIYESPSSGLCFDKLSAVGNLLNLHGSQEMLARARQQLMALLMNSAAGNIHLTEVISVDGATVSQAITYCDNLIDDLEFGNHELAKDIADMINNGEMVPEGMIPLETVQIAYRQGLPSGQFMLSNRPNPFNPSTTISFMLPETASATLRVYDVSGHLVRILLNGAVKSDGPHEVVWNGRNEAGLVVAAGVYFGKLDAGGYSEIQRMTLIK